MLNLGFHNCLASSFIFTYSHKEKTGYSTLSCREGGGNSFLNKSVSKLAFYKLFWTWQEKLWLYHKPTHINGPCIFLIQKHSKTRSAEVASHLKFWQNQYYINGQLGFEWPLPQRAHTTGNLTNNITTYPINTNLILLRPKKKKKITWPNF